MLFPPLLLLLLLLLGGAAAASHHSCNGPLVSLLPQSSFQNSSQSAAGYAAFNAMLNRRDGAGGWSPMVTDQNPWLQVDLGEQMEVTAVATQGRYDSWDWVSSYLLLLSDTGRIWKQYRQEDGVEMSTCRHQRTRRCTHPCPPLMSFPSTKTRLDWEQSNKHAISDCLKLHSNFSYFPPKM